MVFFIAFIILYIPLSIIFPIKIVGKKHIKNLKKSKENFIISCNHMSNNDGVMLDIKFATKFRYLAKKELFKTKFSSWLMRKLGAVPVDRTTADTRAVKEIFSLLNKKKNVCIFPQGTRVKTPLIEGETAKEGVAMFAIRTGTPVLPMMFDRKLRPFHKTYLYIGKPIYPNIERKKDKVYLDEFSNQIIDKMNDLLIENTPKLNTTKRLEIGEKNENERF